MYNSDFITSLIDVRIVSVEVFLYISEFCTYRKTRKSTLLVIDLMIPLKQKHFILINFRREIRDIAN